MTVTIMTKDEIIAQINGITSIINANGGDKLLVNLFQRWMDEREYEDFKDYTNHIKKTMNYIKVKKVSRRPFGIEFTHENLPGFNLSYKIKSMGRGKYALGMSATRIK